MSALRVLVACEYSATVRDVFRALGHDAWSCDLLPTEGDPRWHMECDIFDAFRAAGPAARWDLVIAFPPCTYLAGSGLHWNARRPERAALTDAAVEFVRRIMELPVHRSAVENPIGCLSTRIRRPDQIIQPWQFGEDASKATCLWLHRLPPLVATGVLPGGKSARRANQTARGQNRLGPSPDRWKERSRTYAGVAAAMALQWGGDARVKRLGA